MVLIYFGSRIHLDFIVVVRELPTANTRLKPDTADLHLELHSYLQVIRPRLTPTEL